MVVFSHSNLNVIVEIPSDIKGRIKIVAAGRYKINIRFADLLCRVFSLWVLQSDRGILYANDQYLLYSLMHSLQSIHKLGLLI